MPEVAEMRVLGITIGLHVLARSAHSKLDRG